MQPVGDPAAADMTVESRSTSSRSPGPTPIDEAGAVGFEADQRRRRAPRARHRPRPTALDELPIDATAHVDEEALPDGAFIGEIEGFPAGETCIGVFDLEPGRLHAVLHHRGG